MSDSPSSSAAFAGHSKRPHEHSDDEGGQGSSAANKAKTALNRTSRACNNCRKQKMRCIGAEDPPCKRCRNGSLDCLFEKPLREGAPLGEERIKQLEHQVTSIQSTLSDLVSTLKAGQQQQQHQHHPPPPPHQLGSSSSTFPYQTTNSHGQHPQQQNRPLQGFDPSQYAYPASSSSPAAITSIGPRDFTLDANGRHKREQPSFSPPGGHEGGSGMMDVDQARIGRMQSVESPGQQHGNGTVRSKSISSESSRGGHSSAEGTAIAANGFPAYRPSPYTQPSGSRSNASASGSRHTPLAISENHPYPLPPPIPRTMSSSGTSAYLQPSPANSHQSPYNFAHGPGMPPSILRHASSSSSHLPPSAANHHHSNSAIFPQTTPNSTSQIYPTHLYTAPAQISSARTTPAGSPAGSDAGDQDSDREIELPPQALIAPLRSMDLPSHSTFPTVEETDASGNLMLLAGRATKRARFLEDGDANKMRAKRMEGKDAALGDRVTQMYDYGPPKGEGGKFLGCVEVGILSAEEARELYDIYWAGASRFLAIYDPAFDTFDDLCVRSPFSISAMCFVGARIRDGGGRKSDLQIQLWIHIRRISQETLFRVATRVEACQAMILTAGWNDSGWLIGGHAVRLAYEIACHTAFQKLLRLGMGRGKTGKELEEQRPLVTMARVWFCLYILEHQMSFGNGRPPIIREDVTIHRCREFLNHPLAIETDWRLISTVEMMAIRSPLHLELTSQPEKPVDGETLVKVQTANLQFAKWFEEWDVIFATKFGDTEDLFFRESLRIQKAYAELFHNCTALSDIRGPADVPNMMPAQRDLAIRALRNAQQCLDICLRGKGYRKGLTYAVHYTHVCAAFAASLLVRLARIFPAELDLRQTARDVEELAKILAAVPAGRYARSLRLTLRSARRRKLMPPPSMPGSPTFRNGALPPGSTPNGAFSPSNFINANNAYTQPTPIPSGATSPQLGAEIMEEDESPQADFTTEFDWSYTQDMMDKVGLSMESGQVPLWLHGSDIGSSQLPSSGMENFFLPTDLDFRLTRDTDDLASTLGLNGDGGTGEIW